MFQTLASVFERLSTLNVGPLVLLRLVRAAFIRVAAVLYRVHTDINFSSEPWNVHFGAVVHCSIMFGMP